MGQNKVETLSTVKITNSADLYKIVNCLNRTLKDQDLMFGLALDENDEREKRYSPSIKRKTFMWIAAGIGIVIASLLAYFLYIFQEAIDGKEATFSSSKQLAVQATPLIDSNEIKRFNGEKAYDIVTGETEQGEIGYALIPIDQELEPLFVLEKDGVSESEMRNKWKQNCPNCDLQKITLGIDKGTYIWELIYQDEQDRYVFSYYLFSNGELYEQLK